MSKQKLNKKQIIRRLTLRDFGISLAITLAVSLFLVAVMDSHSFQFFGRIIDRVETDEKVVALTFDDGPTPGKTEQVLDILKRQNIKATFFPIGVEGVKNPAQLKKLVESGNEIGNHSYTHGAMIGMPPRVMERELARADAVLQAAGYKKPVYFRPPYGVKLFTMPYVLAKQSRTTIMWDVAPDDVEKLRNDSEALTNFAVENTHPGSIIILHVMYDHYNASMQSVEPIITKLKSQGYRFVTISELLTYQK